MKAPVLIFGLLFTAVSLAGAQNIDNMVYAKQFPGSTVGAKVAAAQAACNPNTAIQRARCPLYVRNARSWIFARVSRLCPPGVEL
jgi:hypothetical protein